MTSQTEQLQQLWHLYEAEHDHLPTSSREVVAWAVREGKLEIPRIDPLDVLADRMSSALREEYATAPNGERYRVNHAVRVTRNGVQMTFWGIIGFAPPDHMHMAFAQRFALDIIFTAVERAFKKKRYQGCLLNIRQHDSACVYPLPTSIEEVTP